MSMDIRKEVHFNPGETCDSIITETGTTVQLLLCSSDNYKHAIILKYPFSQTAKGIYFKEQWVDLYMRHFTVQ